MNISSEADEHMFSVGLFAGGVVGGIVGAIGGDWVVTHIVDYMYNK